MPTFNDLNLDENIVNALAKLNINTPTLVQEKSINPFLEGFDLIVKAQTGSGKTLAYLCPILQKLINNPNNYQTLILAPTHELVVQIKNVFTALVENNFDLKCQTLIGEANINKQIEKLKEKPQLLIGTPGRVLDLFKKRKLNGQIIKTIVLDEADNLLDNTNRQSVLNIIKSTQKDRHLLAYSASFSTNSLTTLKEWMNSVQFINISQVNTINPNIEHFYIICQERDKFEELRKLINAINPPRALIFEHNGARIDLTCEKLVYHKLKANALYSALDKEQRQNALNDFRKGTTPLLVSSDLSARGLDIPEITHVINLDFPTDISEYVHRCGRSARGNNKGVSISIITAKESSVVRVLEREYGITMQEMNLYKGKMLPAKKYVNKPKKTNSSTSKSKSSKADSKKTYAKKQSSFKNSSEKQSKSFKDSKFKKADNTAKTSKDNAKTKSAPSTKANFKNKDSKLAKDDTYKAKFSKNVAKKD